MNQSSVMTEWKESPERLKAYEKFILAGGEEDMFPLSAEFREGRLAFKNRTQPGRQKADH